MNWIYFTLAQSTNILSEKMGRSPSKQKPATKRRAVKRLPPAFGVLKNNAKRQSSVVDVQKLAAVITRKRLGEEKVKEMTPAEQRNELVKVLNENGPSFSFTALYLRLGRRYRRHFNTDSICVLRTLAEQTGVEPINLLESLKTYRVIKPKRTFNRDTFEGGYSPFGFRFQFGYFKKQEEDYLRCSNPGLHDLISRLKLTSSILEDMVARTSHTTFMNLGRVRESATDEITFELPQQWKRGDEKLSDILARKHEQRQGPMPSSPLDKNKDQCMKPGIRKSSRLLNREINTKELNFDIEGFRAAGSSDCFMEDDSSELEEFEEVDESNKDDSEWLVQEGATADLNSYSSQEADLVFQLGDEDEYPVESYKSKAALRLHLIDSLDKRIWLQVEHRFLAFQIILFVFGKALEVFRIRPKRAAYEGGPQFNDDRPLLHLSYCTTSDCTERREFLRVLTNFCIVFPDEKAVIANAGDLKRLWLKRDEGTVGSDIREYLEDQASSSQDSMIHDMNQVFESIRDLRTGSNLEPNPKGTSAADSERKWWQCIRANVFRHFLNFRANREKKEELRKLAKKHLLPEDDETSENPATTKKPRLKSPSLKKKRKGDQQSSNAESSNMSSSDDDDDNSELLFQPDDEEEEQEDAEPSDSLDVGTLLRQRQRELDAKLADSDNPSYATSENDRLNDTSNTVEKGEPGSTQGEENMNSLPVLRDDRSIVARLKLAAPEDLRDARISSRLVIDHDSCKYHSFLSYLEVYLANLLKRFYHGRVTERLQENQEQPTLSTREVHQVVGSGLAEFIDKDRNVLHVVRPESRLFQHSDSKYNFKVDIPLIINALLDKYQDDESKATDETRSPDAIEVNFCAGAAQTGTDSRGFPNPAGMGKDCFLKGKKYANKLLTMLGNWGVFVFDVNQNMLAKAMKVPLQIREIAADRMKKFLRIKDDHAFGFEHITVRFQEISKFFIARNKKHFDQFNCLLPGSSYTSGLNMCLIDPVTGRLYLLQVIFNYRSAVTSFVVPCYDKVIAVTKHIESLVKLIEKKMLEIYREKDTFFSFPSPLNMDTFYMDDDLTYEILDIQKEDSGREPIELECITLPIGFSRIFSMSAAIHVLQELRQYLTMRQIAELCFAGSLLNTSVRFYYVLNGILEQVKLGKKAFREHPFDDWLEFTDNIFGTWQGGPRPRFQCAGIGDIGTIFGSLVKGGTERLEKVIDVLCKFLEWVDEQKGRDTPEDILVGELEQKFQEVVAEVARAAGPAFGNFGVFRLGIFLTLAIGASLTQPGRHVRQMFFPAKGMASRNHLDNPSGSDMSLEEAEALATVVDDGQHGDEDKTSSEQKRNSKKSTKSSMDFGSEFDVAMKIICGYLGFPKDEVFRDFFECALCESKDSRKLDKVDVLIKGVPMYILDSNGRLMRKLPGKFQFWQHVEPSPYFVRQ